ncbi:uncharacterized protein K452DRAFT_53494 [Aplosporella prunicola CBS 121167]|uniref:Uncharacterized protein n=1 Tax=Aplosporella prunicola CBS 121167 TaxID=1176127 RepID=A0A6A6BAF3_9PEZI|nr:uncharacterized protein K452DRAFT_53494 [Aplosporella prunicola CBS 121167]KAF2140255.1 hypothetical protein K452DRAFT_53494 [Aplosporella prunicola CBS 121167]
MVGRRHARTSGHGFFFSSFPPFPVSSLLISLARQACCRLQTCRWDDRARVSLFFSFFPLFSSYISDGFPLCLSGSLGVSSLSEAHAYTHQHHITLAKHHRIITYSCLSGCLFCFGLVCCST